MRIKLIILALILLSVNVNDGGKEAYRSNSGLTVKI